MEHSPGYAPRRETLYQPSSGDLISAAHFLTMNAYSFAVMHVDGTDSLPIALAQEFLDKFSLVARPQLSASRIRERFNAQVDLADLFESIDTELTAWARGGVVSSQVEPLSDYVQWLIAAHTDDVLASFDTETRLTVERRLALAKARSGYEDTEIDQ